MLSKQIFISFSSVLIIGFTGFIAIPFLTRMLTPEEMGKIFLILTVVGLMQVFDGLRPVITFMYNEKKYNETVLLEIIKKINLLFILSVSIIIFLVAYFLFHVSKIQILFFIITFVFYSLMSAQWGVLDTKNHINFTSILRSIGWVFTYSLFVLFAYFQVPIELYIIPLAAINILLFVSFKLKASSLAQKNEKKILTQNEYQLLFRSVFMQVLENIKIQISASILLTMDKIIIPLLLGYNQFGFYAVQSELATKSYLINSTWKRVLFPYLAQKENRNKLDIFINYTYYLFILSFILLLIMGIYGKEIIGFYAGEPYRDYGMILSLLILVFPLNILGTMGVLILQINGDFKLHHRIYRNSAIINIFIFSILTYLFGITGAAVGLLISRSTDLYLYFIALNKYVIKVATSTIITIIVFYLGIIITVVIHKLLFAFCLLGVLSLLLLNTRNRVNK